MRITLRLALLLLVLTGSSHGCAWNLPATAKPGDGCGDPCAAMSCPADFHCTWTPNCHPRCEANTMTK